MRESMQTKTKPIPKTDIKEMLWTLLKDRIEEDVKKLQKRKNSYVDANQVPGAGE